MLICSVTLCFLHVMNDNRVLKILDAQTFSSKFPNLKPTLLYSNDSGF